MSFETLFNFKRRTNKNVQNPFLILNIDFSPVQVPLRVVMVIFFSLDASSKLFNKLMIITSYNMIKRGGVIQGELTRSVFKISGASTASIY